jgi:hypothetical protein
LEEAEVEAVGSVEAEVEDWAARRACNSASRSCSCSSFASSCRRDKWANQTSGHVDRSEGEKVIKGYVDRPEDERCSVERGAGRGRSCEK